MLADAIGSVRAQRSDAIPMRIDNAGLVMLQCFFEPLFSRLELTEKAALCRTPRNAARFIIYSFWLPGAVKHRNIT